MRQIFKSTAMHLSIAACIVVPSAAWAQPRPIPTRLKGSDCVAMRIFVARPRAEIQQELKQCKQASKWSKAQFEACRNKFSYGLEPEVRFFTDQCRGGYLIALDGKEYPLTRVGKENTRPPYLTGTYQGDHIKLEVTSAQLLAKYYDEYEEEKTERNVEAAYYLAKIKITAGQKINQFDGIILYGK